MTEPLPSKTDFSNRPNRRNEDRVAIHSPCIMIPILAEGFPDEGNISVGYALDISLVGIGFEVAGDNRINTNQIIFGMEDDDGDMNFVTALVRFSESQTASRRIGAEYVLSGQQLFKPRNILPFYDAEGLKFETGLSTAALQAWEDCGVLVETMHDRVLVCPKCQSLPTWREGCPNCGSASTVADQLIHHYACAHIGLASTFINGNPLKDSIPTSSELRPSSEMDRRCPKCLVKDLVVGADFEYLNGPHRCSNCGWTDSKLSSIGNCLSCDLRFPGHQAIERTVNGYDVKRLDPLVFLS